MIFAYFITKYDIIELNEPTETFCSELLSGKVENKLITRSHPAHYHMFRWCWDVRIAVERLLRSRQIIINDRNDLFHTKHTKFTIF